MNVLLISANTEQVNIPSLPLGLAQVAAATEQAGHRVSLLNLMLERDPGSAIERAIAAAAPSVIGISVRNIDDQSMQQPRFLLPAVKDVVRTCRDRAAAPIVIGGAGYSIFPDAALAYLGADYGVRGEGERAFPQLISRFARHEDIPDLSGIHVAGRPRTADAPTLEPELDRFPAPEPVRWLSGTPADFMVPVQSRRGCGLDCSYCSTASIEGRTVRARTPHSVALDLARARGAGFRRFYFVDNTFNLPESYALALCREIVRLDLDVEWRCIVYPSALSSELAEAMRAAGCVEASLGFESGSETVLGQMNKRFGVEDVRTTSRRLADHGIRRHGFLLLGGPGETKASIGSSLEFARSLGLDSLKVTLGIRIYPGTPLHRTAVAEGVVSRDNDLLLPTFYLARGLDPAAFPA
jgi:radical SAM superfamily enzyme YgiQ (UPF0313 family)